MDFTNIQSNFDFLKGLSLQEFSEQNGKLILNGFYPMKISNLAPVFDCDQDSQIKKEDGTCIGWFCPTKAKGNTLISGLTELQQLCLIFDAPSVVVLELDYYVFDTNYILISKDYFEDYLSFWKGSSPFWGGFLHFDDIPTKASGLPTTEFTVIDNLKFHPLAKEILVDSINSSSFGDVFLKCYHQIELLTDLIFVNRIKSLTDEIYGLQEIVSAYTSKDFDKLKTAIMFFKDDVDWVKILTIINNSSSFTQKAQIIFDRYGKEANPIKENNSQNFWDDFSTGSVKEASLKKYSSIKELDTFLATLTAYWLFRIRCSLAHKRIGEYIFSRQDDSFIVEFGFPILFAVLKGLFSSQKVHNLLQI